MVDEGQPEEDVRLSKSYSVNLQCLRKDAPLRRGGSANRTSS